MMTRFSASYNQSSNCCASAAACSSARILPILDAAVLLVVSIFVALCLLPLRILALGA